MYLHIYARNILLLLRSMTFLLFSVRQSYPHYVIGITVRILSSKKLRLINVTSFKSSETALFLSFEG